ncbi:MAG: beta-lactamase family protein [Clostridia bacterium]|nr:beta-lactamase family protein [Clostridia bacterium]
MDFSKIDKFMDDMPLRGVVGCELAVSVKGETVYRKCVGYADAEKTKPLSGKDISWIFSCSKVITCLTVMRLVEEGKISLDDPVSKYIPEFSDMFVYDKKTGVLSRAKNVMTVEHLFTMSAGLNYNINATPIKEAAEKEGATTLDVVRAMAKLPLDFEPGERYQYSLCHDVLAAVAEVASGMRFSDYMQKNVFDPLGIVDMGFRPNEAQTSRFCDQFNYSNGTNRSTYCGIKNRYILSPDYDSGGAGLFSTVDEYMKIITAIANGGKTKDGYSLLRPETIELLTVNRLCDRALDDLVKGRLFGYGWGLCGRVHRDAAASCSLAPIGEFGWDGAAGAFSMIDTRNNVALYFGTNTFGFTYGYNFVHPTLRNMVYEAIEL